MNEREQEEQQQPAMIELTRLNGNPFIVNSDLVKWVEAAPDTMLTLIHGEKVVVRESPAEVRQKIARLRADLLAQALILTPAGFQGIELTARTSAAAAAAALAAVEAARREDLPADPEQRRSLSR